MKLYKFRSLGSCTDLARTIAIIQTGEFWCSQFWELNDPMEGVYHHNAETRSVEVVKEIFNAKSRVLLCSFSGQAAFGNPLMWGYYANGFKGAAMEIEVAEDSSKFVEIKYVAALPAIDAADPAEDRAKRILTTKLDVWKHEHEYRYMIQGETGSYRIGNITAVYFGDPYGITTNAADVRKSSHLREYRCRANKLIQVARSRNIPCHRVKYDDDVVMRDDQIHGDDLLDCGI